ncbi:MAG: hypothetical protein KI790_11095 [Cyclobacteriaceae bacterium]|nr:hypothetical protein [Cyclobacteriaceae bacterium HetDA_MAG_MS6]
MDKSLPFLIGLLCSLSLTVKPLLSQPAETMLAEEEVDLKIVTKHYLKYPKMTPFQWGTFQENDETYFKAYLGSEETAEVIIYNRAGKPLEKWDIITETPIVVREHLDFELAKYKVLSYKKVTNLLTGSIYFVADVKSRFRGYLSVKFNTSGEPVLNGISQFAVNDD